MTPVTGRVRVTAEGMLVRTVAGAQRPVFGDRDLDDARLGQRRLYAIVHEPRELLAGGNPLAVGELGNVEIDVAVVEPRPHLRLERAIEHGQIDQHAGPRVDLAGDGDLARVAV